VFAQLWCSVVKVIANNAKDTEVLEMEKRRLILGSVEVLSRWNWMMFLECRVDPGSNRLR